MENQQTTFEEFQKSHMRAGTIVHAELIPDARYSTHLVQVDFGDEFGVRKTCARLVKYDPTDLIGLQVIGLTNIPPRQVGKHMSEFLILAVDDAEGGAQLLHPDTLVPNGGKVH